MSGARLGALPSQSDRREILRKHRTEGEPRRDPAAVSLPADICVSELRRLLAEQASAQPLPAGVTVTAAALGGVPTAEITTGGIEPRQAGHTAVIKPQAPGRARELRLLAGRRR
jgi:hypothetical protein